MSRFFAMRRCGADPAAMPGRLIARERKVWMRMRSHTVIFERDPDWNRYKDDPSGQVIRVVQLWLVDPEGSGPQARHFLGSVRYSDRWVSRQELGRLYRRMTATARLHHESGACWRGKLSRFLRGYLRGPARSCLN